MFWIRFRDLVRACNSVTTICNTKELRIAYNDEVQIL